MKIKENENKKNLNRLVNFIEARPKHGIVLAEVNSIPLRDRLIEKLDSLCQSKGLSISTLSLSNLPVYTNIPVFIREELTNLLPQDGILIIDFANLLSIAENENNFMRGFNFSREVFIDIKLPVVFWLSTHIINLMVQYAPDIWSWRSLVIKFEEERVPLAKEREEEFGSTESAEAKKKKIGILETQLKDAVAKGVGDEEMAREILLPLANAYAQDFNYKKAIELYLELVAIHRKIGNQEGEASDLNALGMIHHTLAEHEMAIGYLEQALKIDRAVFGDQHPNVARDLNSLGLAWYDLGEHKKAIDYYEQALAIWKAVYGEKHPNVAAALNNLGEALRALGKHQKAIGYYEQALKIDKAVFGDQHPNVAIRLNNLGLAWDALGEPKKAIGYYEEALAIDEAVYGKKHPTVATMLNNLGLVWAALGEHKKAIQYFEQALAIDEAVYGKKHPTVATKLNNLGGAWDDLGEHKKAIQYYEQALAIDEAVYGKKHPNVARDLNNLGGVWYELGDLTRAKGYFRSAYLMIRDFLGNQHPHTKIAKEWLDGCK